MKNTMKKGLAIFLIALMIFTSVPIAYATDGVNATMDDETSISAENGLSKIIENLTEAEEELADTGYSISDMTFDGITANVTVNVPAECTLVVAVYDEDTLEMLSSATKQLSASVYSEDHRKDIISIDMNVLVMPEHFLAKAFLLDDNKNALCKNYICRTYTTAFEIFMETTPADFAGKDIITMDDNCDDFGVLVDGAVAAKKSDTMTYTYDNGVYTFYNAIDEVKSLKADDIFYYQLSDEIGDFLLIKVASVDVDGSTVTIVEDDDIALGDAFQFVRIDEDADFSDIELTEDNLGSALSLQEPEMQASVMSSREIVVEENESYTTSLNIKYPQKGSSENDDPYNNEFEVEGSLKYTIAADISLYYDIRFGKDFYKLQTNLTHTVGINVAFAGKVECNKEYFKIAFPTIPMGPLLELDISVYPVLSAEAAMEFFGGFEVYNCFSYTDSDGLSKINDTKWWEPDGDFGKTEIKIKFGLGVDFDIGFKKGKTDNEGLSTIHISVTLSGEFGIKGSFVPSLIGNLLDKHHDCIFCLEGSLSVFANGKATLKIKIISNSLKFNWDAVDLTFEKTIGDCYFSIGSHGTKLGFGTCPYISHKVTVNVYDNNGNPVKDAVVSTTTGYCDADGDKKFKETSMNTDENGQAAFYFAKGQHEIIAKKDGIGTSVHQFEMLANEKEITLELFDAEYFNGNYYKVYDSSRISWSDAKTDCEKMGGHLVVITSKEENDFVTSLLKGAQYHIGASDTLTEGVFLWVTGEDWSYSNWDQTGDKEPNNLRNQDYVVIQQGSYASGSQNAPGSWDDISTFSDISGYVCEWETIPTISQTMLYRMATHNLSEPDETSNDVIVEDTTATRTDALIGAEYVVTVIKDETAEDFFSNENLLYIDQKTAESSTVSFDFVLPKGVADYTVKIFGVSHTHTPAKAVKENEVSATCTAGGRYDEVTYCSVCGEEINRETATTGKLPHEYISTVTQPTCTENGITTYTCSCGDSYTETIEATGHDFDGSKCKICNYDKAENCSCNCHKGGIMGFFWKIINFFNKLFKSKQFCACGAKHW